MAKETIISISNGQGIKELVNGNYSVTASIPGYNNLSILPTTQEITEGQNEYTFTIAASGTINFKVTEDGTADGTPIVGATIYRTDATGQEYGNGIITNELGEASLTNVPFSSEGNAPTVYYKQTISDNNHTFTSTVQSTTLDTETKEITITNPLAPERTIKLTDLNYDGLPIENGNITLSSN